MSVLLSNEQTLPAYRRIRCHSEFESTLKGNALTNKWFTIYVRDNAGDFTRLGMIVSKKIMPKAVSRNFTKRLIRNIFRINFVAPGAMDVVVRARKHINSENSQEGRHALTQLLHAVMK